MGVNKRDLSNYSTLCLISLIGSILVFALLPLIPTKTQLKEWKAVRSEEEAKKSVLRKNRRLEREEEEKRLLDVKDIKEE